jgi:aryl-alcohol dehydrogenase-like predicted oxidoreductase
VPACQASGAAVVVGSGLFMGLLGGRFDAWIEKPPVHIAPVYVERARRMHALAADAGLSLSHLALRFTWSMPAVDFVLAGASRWGEWIDTVAAFEAGPLPSDLYRRVWDIATRGPEPACGG